MDLQPGDVRNGYTDISVKAVLNPGKSPNDKNQSSQSYSNRNVERYISREDFYDSVHTSGIGLGDTPSNSESYRCQLCGEIVDNDVCTDCMFDRDN